MTPAGEHLVSIAQQNGMWEFLDDVEKLEVPEDLAIALGAARACWEGFPRSVRRAALEWVKTAKRPETRAARIHDIAERAQLGQRPTPFS